MAVVCSIKMNHCVPVYELTLCSFVLKKKQKRGEGKKNKFRKICLNTLDNVPQETVLYLQGDRQDDPLIFSISLYCDSLNKQWYSLKKKSISTFFFILAYKLYSVINM